MTDKQIWDYRRFRCCLWQANYFKEGLKKITQNGFIV